jgi:hypothetical protein
MEMMKTLDIDEVTAAIFLGSLDMSRGETAKRTIRFGNDSCTILGLNCWLIIIHGRLKRDLRKPYSQLLELPMPRQLRGTQLVDIHLPRGMFH